MKKVYYVYCTEYVSGQGWLEGRDILQLEKMAAFKSLEEAEGYVGLLLTDNPRSEYSILTVYERKED